MDSQALLQPITAEAPCGESLEDTPLLASFDGFRLFGQAAPLDPVPDWADIQGKSLEALGRSKDLRLLAHLGCALLRTEGIGSFSDSLDVAATWLERYWNEVFPLVTEDAILRRNAINCFGDPMAVVDGLRRVPLVSSRTHGIFSLRDLDIAAGQTPPRDGEERPDPARIDAAFASMPIEDLAALHASIDRAAGALKRIDVRMRDAGGPDAAPSLDALSACVGRMLRSVTAHFSARPQAPPSADAAASAAEESPAGAVGAIKSRQDAIRALDAVADFFQRTEPSSPIPLFLGRAKRLVSKDFLEVLADIAPDAVPQARAAGGLRNE